MNIYWQHMINIHSGELNYVFDFLRQFNDLKYNCSPIIEVGNGWVNVVINRHSEFDTDLDNFIIENEHQVGAWKHLWNQYVKERKR